VKRRIRTPAGRALRDAMLAGQQSCEARRRAQFPGKRASAVRPIERLLEIAVGGRRGYWPVLTNKLTVEAQEFGE